MTAKPIAGQARKHYRCPSAAVSAAAPTSGPRRSTRTTSTGPGRSRRMPTSPAAVCATGSRSSRAGPRLVDGLLDLHTPRQLVGLEAILDRIESDLRAAPVEAALRLALLHALLPASRLNGYPGRIGTLRIQGGRVRPPGSGQWRERNPWLAFEDGIRLVRGFIQRLEAGLRAAPSRRASASDLRSLDDGTATRRARRRRPVDDAVARRRGDPVEAGESGPAVRRRVRLVLGQPPVRPNQERLSMAYWATAWASVARPRPFSRSPRCPGSAIRAPWGWQAAALARSLASVEPSLARDGARRVPRRRRRTGGARRRRARRRRGGLPPASRPARGRRRRGLPGIVELIPPGAVDAGQARERGPTSRSTSCRAARATRTCVPAPGLFVAPERFDRRPFSAAEVCPDRRPSRRRDAQGPRRAGPPRATARRDPRRAGPGRPAAPPHGRGRGGRSARGGCRRGARSRAVGPGPGRGSTESSDEDLPDTGDADASPPNPDDEPDGFGTRGAASPRPTPARIRRPVRPAETSTDQVDALLALIRDELSRTGHRRLTEIEPGRWWLADPADRAAAAAPLADRVEWAVYSLLSTAGPLSESSFFERIAALFSGHDLPDEALVRACLQSYRSMASTPDRLVTGDDLLRRTQQHAETIAQLADGGHRLGMNVWIGRREQARKLGSRRLGDWLDEREHRAYLVHISRAVDDVAEVDCIWYVRGRAALLFEVEWTAMLGEPLLRRHARIPQDDSLVRFLVVAPERTELIRHKLERSPLLREAVERDNWHVIKWNHLRAFLGPRSARSRRPGALPRARSRRRAIRRADAAVRGLTGRSRHT